MGRGLFGRLFGGGGSPPALPAETYQGYRIQPEPVAEGGQFRLAAWIEAEIDGVQRRHHLIRADIFSDRDAAGAAAVGKARKLIDEQGMSLFD